MNKIPEGWRKVKFGDVVNRVKDEESDRSKWNTDKYVGGQHFPEGEIRVTDYGSIEEDEWVIGSAFKVKFKPGDVLYVTRNPRLRKGGMVDFEGIRSDVTYVLRADENQLLQSLLPFIIQTEDFVKNTCNNAHGSTNPFLNWKDIAKYEFYLPPLEEQKKISEVLWSVEENIRKSFKEIQKLKLFYNKMLKSLYTGNNLSGEKVKTKIGNFSKDYNVGYLYRGIKDISYGYTASANKKQVGPKFLRITDIASGNLNWNAVPYCECNDKDFNRYKLDKGDIVFARTGASTGESEIIDSDPKAVFASYLIRIKLKENINPHYVAFYFKSKLYWKQINSLIAGSAQGGVNAQTLRKLIIPLPELEIQNKTVKIIKNMNDKMQEQSSNLNTLKSLRNKLLNELLLGKLRLEGQNVQ